MNVNFFKDKKIFITGHNGFKGSWLCRILLNAGAKICGYSLPLEKKDNLFELADVKNDIEDINGDIRDYSFLQNVFNNFNPEIVIHLAAQPIVRESYKEPKYTYETNVMGTVNILECVRHSNNVSSFLNVTTDKVYKNNEWCWGYRENEDLNGFDPYSNSKSCSELVTDCYKRSFFIGKNVAISTARAGNVIGGGDFANDRIIPDCIRAQLKKEPIIVRNPYSIRPYQHVLEALFAYLLIVEKQMYNNTLAGSYNVGPDEAGCVSTGELVSLFCKYWGSNASWQTQIDENAPHEANFLRLDCLKLKTVFDWQPHWSINEAVKYTCDWNKIWMNDKNIADEMDKEITEYIKEGKRRDMAK